MDRIIKIVAFCFAFQMNAYNLEHVKKLQQAVQNQQFVNASRADFRGLGALLKGADLTGAQLSGALFDAFTASVEPKPFLVQVANQVSNLSGVNFSNATLVSTSFKNAILKGANFAVADICYADFTGADLTGALGLGSAKNERLALFCNTTMPDGTKPTGKTWTDPVSGKVFYMRCSS
jgi:uncharacterized protein YjbI with pentapeptide repeats